MCVTVWLYCAAGGGWYLEQVVVQESADDTDQVVFPAAR